MTSPSHEYDVVVVGGGTAGLSAARTAMRLGKRAALVSDGPLGGDCTFTGCVPSKTLIEAAAAGLDAKQAFARIHETVARIAATETAAVLRSEGVDVVEGRGSFVPGGGFEVDGTPLRSSKFVLATGSRPALPPIPGLDLPGVITNEELFEADDAPESMAILGAGPIGCELAQALARLGVRVTVFEMAERVLPLEEPEASAVAAAALGADGVDLRPGHRVTSVVAHDRGQLRVCTDQATEVVADQVLVALGRRPVTEGLGLEHVGVITDGHGHVDTRSDLRTTRRGVWAAGDVTGKLPFTHAADEMGRLAGYNASIPLARFRFHPAWIPWVTFTDPEVARVGVSEADAPDSARVAYLPMGENDRAVTADETEGFVKLIVGPDLLTRHAAGGRVLGATIVAKRAGEMIHEPTLAMRTRMLAGRLAQTVHAYPTWSIGIQKAAAQLFFEIEGRRARRVRTARHSAKDSPRDSEEST